MRGKITCARLTAVYFKKFVVSPNSRYPASQLLCLVRRPDPFQTARPFLLAAARVAINLNVVNPIYWGYGKGGDSYSFIRSDGPVDGLHYFSGFSVVM